MNTVNRSNRSVATSQNWIGSTTKKASTRLRWSPRRVGESVMNSRSAKKAIKANSTVATISPAAHANQKTTTMNHDVRISLRKFFSSAYQASSCASRGSRKVSRNAVTLITARTPNTVKNNAATCCDGVRLRRNSFTKQGPHAWPLHGLRCPPGPSRLGAARRRSSHLAQHQHGLPRAVEEGAAVFFGSQLDRRAERHRAQDGHRHHFALGHDALDVVDPGRHQNHLRKLLREVVQARLERLRLLGVAARAFGEDDDRVAVLQRLHERLQRVLLAGA